MNVYNITDDNGHYYGTYSLLYDAIRAAWDMYCKYYLNGNYEDEASIKEAWNELDNEWCIDGAVYIEEYTVDRDYVPEYPLPID